MPQTTHLRSATLTRAATKQWNRALLALLCASIAMGCSQAAPTLADAVDPADPTAPGAPVAHKPPPAAPTPPATPTASNPTAPTEVDTVAVVTHADRPGFAVASDFLGMSFEVNDAINNPRLADPTLVRFLQNLGPGVLRYGGVNADLHWWNPTTRVTRSDKAPVITNADFTTLFAFARAAGWKVIYTVNLVNLKPDTAAAEVQALTAAGGSSLIGISIGNEPDQYVGYHFRSSGWGWSNLRTEWESYANAIQARTPSTKFIGLDGCCVSALNWLPSFVSAEGSRVIMGAHHIYPEWAGASAGTNYYPSIPDLLSTGTTGRVTGDVKELYTAVGGASLPLRITESNSVASGGTRGVSDVFAASLWSVEHMFTLAENGAVGVNFHGAFSGGIYQPIDGVPGNYTARPLYYGMLAFHTAAQGKIVPVTIVSHKNVTVHATTADDGTLRVTAINRDPTTAVQVRINPGRTFTHAGTLRLLGPSLSATSGVTFAGSGVSSDGTWTPAAQEPVYTAAGIYAISVPAGSAAIVTLSP